MSTPPEGPPPSDADTVASAEGHASAAKEAAADAADHASEAKKAAVAAQGNAGAANDAAKNAQAAATQAGLVNEPSWIYAMVIGILGAVVVLLVIAMFVLALKNDRIPDDVESAATLVLGGLIGVLAPTPVTKKK
jgi:cobalamin biosynthesis Mg chelatase CobN